MFRKLNSLIAQTDKTEDIWEKCRILESLSNFLSIKDSKGETISNIITLSNFFSYLPYKVSLLRDFTWDFLKEEGRLRPTYNSKILDISQENEDLISSIRYIIKKTLFKLSTSNLIKNFIGDQKDKLFYLDDDLNHVPLVLKLSNKTRRNLVFLPCLAHEYLTKTVTDDFLDIKCRSLELHAFNEFDSTLIDYKSIRTHYITIAGFNSSNYPVYLFDRDGSKVHIFTKLSSTTLNKIIMPNKPVVTKDSLRYIQMQRLKLFVEYNKDLVFSVRDFLNTCLQSVGATVVSISEINNKEVIPIYPYNYYVRF